MLLALRVKTLQQVGTINAHLSYTTHVTVLQACEAVRMMEGLPGVNEQALGATLWCAPPGDQSVPRFPSNLPTQLHVSKQTRTIPSHGAMAVSRTALQRSAFEVRE